MSVGNRAGLEFHQEGWKDLFLQGILQSAKKFGRRERLPETPEEERKRAICDKVRFESWMKSDIQMDGLRNRPTDRPTEGQSVM